MKEIIAGYRVVNAWEHEEERRRLPRLTIKQAARQYFEMWELAGRVSPEAEELFLEERMAHYEALHRRLEKAALVMGRVDQD